MQDQIKQKKNQKAYDASHGSSSKSATKSAGSTPPQKKRNQEEEKTTVRKLTETLFAKSKVPTAVDLDEEEVDPTEENCDDLYEQLEQDMNTQFEKLDSSKTPKSSQMMMASSKPVPQINKVYPTMSKNIPQAKSG